MGRKKLQTEKFFENKRKTKYYIFMFFIFTIVLSLISMFTGRYGMSLLDTINSVIGIKKGIEADNIRKIIFNIRMPRTIASVVIGGILAISGLTYQCVFRNTLVSQDILGVSTSACVGAALGIIMVSTIFKYWHSQWAC